MAESALNTIGQISGVRKLTTDLPGRQYWNNPKGIKIIDEAFPNSPLQGVKMSDYIQKPPSDQMVAETGLVISALGNLTDDITNKRFPLPKVQPGVLPWKSVMDIAHILDNYHYGMKIGADASSSGLPPQK